jgi:polyisoprenoid-binding protein YceI
LADVLHFGFGGWDALTFESATVQFDLSSPKISGSVVVAAGTGKNGNDTSDCTMSTDVLNVPKVAGARLVPRHMNGSIASAGDSAGRIDGVFTLHGTPHEVTVPGQIHIEVKTSAAKNRFIIPSVNWGLKHSSALLLEWTARWTWTSLSFPSFRAL